MRTAEALPSSLSSRQAQEAQVVQEVIEEGESSQEGEDDEEFEDWEALEKDVVYNPHRKPAATDAGGKMEQGTPKPGETRIEPVKAKKTRSKTPQDERAKA